MSGFIIANIDVKNPEAYKEYIEKVRPIVEKFGGEYLVRAGEYKVIDGEWKYPRTVIIKFPTYEKALEWFNSEDDIAKARPKMIEFLDILRETLEELSPELGVTDPYSGTVVIEK